MKSIKRFEKLPIKFLIILISVKYNLLCQLDKRPHNFMMIFPSIFTLFTCMICIKFTNGLIKPKLSPLLSPPLSLPSTDPSIQEPVPSTTFLSPSTLTIFSTYASDFNNVEYLQRLSHYQPELEELGIENFYVIVNADMDATKEIQDLIPQKSGVTFLSDPTGAAGRMFGVSRGWRPDDSKMSPYFKLYMMLFGFGCWATLPAVIGGYIGNPGRKQSWITSALMYNTEKGYFPTNAIKDGSNMFDDLPVVGSWGRRPLELATLRLQNMIGISIPNWKSLAPSESNLNVLTQLGGLVITDENGAPRWEWRDKGICDVANFEDILDSLKGEK